MQVNSKCEARTLLQNRIPKNVSARRYKSRPHSKVEKLLQKKARRQRRRRKQMLEKRKKQALVAQFESERTKLLEDQAKKYKKQIAN